MRVETTAMMMALASSVVACGSDGPGTNGPNGNILSPGEGPPSDEAMWTPFPGFRRGLPNSPDSVMDVVTTGGHEVMPFLGRSVDRHYMPQETRPFYPYGIWLGTSDAGVTRIARARDGDDGPELWIPHVLRDGLALSLVDDFFALVYRRDTKAWTPHGIRRLWWTNDDADVVVEGRGPGAHPHVENRQSVNPLERPVTKASAAPMAAMHPLLGGEPLLDRGWYVAGGAANPGVMPEAPPNSPWFRPVHVEAWRENGGIVFRLQGTCYERSEAGPYFPENCTPCFRYDANADVLSSHEPCEQPNAIDPSRGQAPMPTAAQGFTVETSVGTRVLTLEGETIVTGPAGGPHVPVFPPLPVVEPGILAAVAAPTADDPGAIAVVVSDVAATSWIRVGSDGRTTDGHIGIGGAARRSHIVQADGHVRQWRVQPEGTIERVVADGEGLWIERTVRVEPPPGQVVVGVIGEDHDGTGRVTALYVLGWGRLRMWDYPDGDRLSTQPDLGDLYLNRVELPAEEAPVERQNPLFSLEARDLGPDARVCWPHGFEAPATTGWTIGDATVPATVLPFDDGRCVLVVRGIGGVADMATHEVIGPVPGAGRVAVGVGARHQSEAPGAGVVDTLDAAVVDWAMVGTLRDGGFRTGDAVFEVGFSSRVATERLSAAWDPGQGAVVVPDRAGDGIWASWWDGGLRVVELRGRQTERFTGETGVPRPDIFVAGGGVAVEDGAGLAVRRADGTRQPLSAWAEAGALYRVRVILPNGVHCGQVRRDVVDASATCPFPGLVGQDLWNCIGFDVACVDASGQAGTAPGADLNLAALWPEGGVLQYDGVALPAWYAFRAKASDRGPERWVVIVDSIWTLEVDTMQATPLLTAEDLRDQGLEWPRGASIFVSTAMDGTGHLFAHARIEASGSMDHHLFDMGSGAAVRIDMPAVRGLGLGAVNLVAVEPALWLLSRGAQVSDIVRIPRR